MINNSVSIGTRFLFCTEYNKLLLINAYLPINTIVKSKVIKNKVYYSTVKYLCFTKNKILKLIGNPQLLL